MGVKTKKTRRRFQDWEIVQKNMDFTYREKVRCKCVCWKEKSIFYSSLVYWKATNCWCKSNKILKEKSTKHWLSNTRIWDIYYNIRKRCYNEKHLAYKYYWGKWVKCNRNTFESFINDMYESYKEHCKAHWEKDTEIDRINNNWNYCKKNCRWATNKEQTENRKKTRKFYYMWRKMTIRQISDHLNINKHTLKRRIDTKWYQNALDYYSTEK